jgi:hypothetical protein
MVNLDFAASSPTVPPRSWPELERTGRWPATQDYLHLVVQMLGKLRLALAPALPEWFHTSLALGPRGLTTGILPSPTGSLEARLDLLDAVIRVDASDRRTGTIKLDPARPIAEIWRDYMSVFRELGIVADLWDKPQERTDVTPFSEDDTARDYDPALAAAWFALLTEVHGTFNSWRSPFFGRSGVQFWWGGFDLTVVLFSGRPSTPRAGADYVMRYDLDAEQLTIGFWPGDDAREAMFFAYLVPEPAACAVYPLPVPSAAWAPAMGEWVLPYAAVRESDNRNALLRGFMDTIFRAAGELGGWDLARFTYALPPRRSRMDAIKREPS